MPKVFSDKEKEVINKKLLDGCKKSWETSGYKETKISNLCKNAGISKGAFYIFFDSKEAIFVQVLKDTQKQLYQRVEHHLMENQNKKGIVNGMKEIFKVYCDSPFMYNTQSIDFQYFLSKLDKKQNDEMNNVTYAHTKLLFQKPYLVLKVDEKLAISLFTLMLSTVSQRDNMLYDEKKVFDFMIDRLIDDIYE